MRIGIVTTWFERGAAYVSRQFMELLQKTDDVYIYARGGEKYAKGNPKWDLPNVHWGKRSWSNWVTYGSTYIDKKDFHRWLDKNRIELVFFNEQRFFDVLLWCKDWKIRTAAYVDYYTEKLIPLYDIYDCLICNTKRHAFAFRNNPNTRYLKWGTNLELYKPGTEEHERIVFFNSAGMDPFRKGTDLTIRAFYNLNNRKQAKLLIHTQVPLVNKMPELGSIINELLNEGSLEIVEKTVTAPGLYNKADIYVYPSRLDGIGLTLMEAAASGLACITIDNAPMNEFLDESFGRVCEVDHFYCRSDGYYWPVSVANIPSLTSIMDSFVDGVSRLKEMKANARSYAERELDFYINLKALHSIFNQTIFQFNKTVYDRVKNAERSNIRTINRLLKPFWQLFYFFRKEARPYN